MVWLGRAATPQMPTSPLCKNHITFNYCMVTIIFGYLSRYSLLKGTVKRQLLGGKSSVKRFVMTCHWATGHFF
jgi:hypothetical protein